MVVVITDIAVGVACCAPVSAGWLTVDRRAMTSAQAP
jgi:hypothetical protein